MGLRRRAGRPPACDPEIEQRLEAWGAAVGGTHRPGDWPEKTLLARLIEFGPMGSAQGATQRGPSLDPAIDQTERAVARLPARHRRAVVAFYAGRNRGNVSVCARECRMSCRTLRETLKHARDFLGSLLITLH